MSNVEQQSIVFALNQKFLDGGKLALNDFEAVKDPNIFNKFAKRGVLDELVSLLKNIPQDVENHDHYTKLAAERLAQMSELKDSYSELGYASRSNMNGLRTHYKKDSDSFNRE